MVSYSFCFKFNFQMQGLVEKHLKVVPPLIKIQ